MSMKRCRRVWYREERRRKEPKEKEKARKKGVAEIRKIGEER